MDANKMKREVLASMSSLSGNLDDKIKILQALDRDSGNSGAFDLHDQLVTLFEVRTKLDRVIERSIAVVPRGG